ncbi:MAG: OprO/OprP family phosphate-selective porin [Gammaproteobacteria bacterium]
MLTVGSAAADFKVEPKAGGLKVWKENSPYWFKVGGFFQADEAMYFGSETDKKNDFPSGAKVRRARLSVSGGIAQDWTYGFTYDFTQKVIIEAALYNSNSLGDFGIGAQGVSFGLSNSGSSKDLVFLEDSVASNNFAPDDILGLTFNTQLSDMFTLQTALGHPNANSTLKHSSTDGAEALAANSENGYKSQRVAVLARLAFSPVHTEDTAYHIGASVYHQGLAATAVDGNPVGYSPLSVKPDITTRNTGTLIAVPSSAVGNSAGVDAGRDRYSFFHHYVGELGAGWGPLVLSGEYFTTKHRRPWSNQGDAHFKGHHVQVSYVLTGETRPYDNASKTFGRPSPNTECGAWEVALRHAAINLNSKNVRGGKVNGSTTLGVNWYYTDNLRFAANYSHTRWTPVNDVTVTQSRYDLPKRSINALGLRAQWVF